MKFTSHARLCRIGWRGVTVLCAALMAVACGGGAAQGAGPEAPAGGDSELELGEEGESSGDGSSAAGSTGDTAAPAPPKGARAEEKRAMSLKATFKLVREDGRDAGISAKGWSFEEGRTAVVEETAGGAVTQLAVIYGKREGKGLEDWTPLPTEGKGYTAKAEPGAELIVMDAHNNRASAAEHDVIAHEYSYVGKAQPLLAQIVASGAGTGDTVTLDKAGALALIGYMPEMEVDELSAVHQGTQSQGGRAAIALDVKFRSTLKENEAVYVLDLSGPAYVDQKTGWVIKLELNGEVKVSGHLTHKGKRLGMKGKGTATLTRQANIR